MLGWNFAISQYLNSPRAVFVYILGALFFAFLLGVVALTVTKILEWQAKKKKIRREIHQTKFRPDGRPYPPFDRGLCDRCGRAFEKVYYLPSGRRLCPDCYREEENIAGDSEAS